MAKGVRRRGGANRKRQQGPQQRQQQASGQPAQPSSTRAAEIKAFHEEASSNATAEDKAALTDDPRPNDMDLDGMWKMVSEARNLFNAQKDRAERTATELEAQRASLKEKEAEVESRVQEVDQRETKLEEKAHEVEDRTRQVGERELAIRAREADADLGFEKKRSEMLSAYDGVIAERSEAIDLRERELYEREDALRTQARELEKRGRELQWEEEDVQEQRVDLRKHVDRAVAARHEEYKDKLASLTAERDQARTDRDRHAEALAKREDADRLLGQRSPEELLKKLDALEAENGKLRDDLAERLGADATQRLDDLAREQQAWQAERLDLTRKVSDLKRCLAYADNDAGEREAQRDRIASLVAQQGVLRKANEELRAEVDELMDTRESQSPFPTCTAVDEDEGAQRTGQTDEDLGSLKEFAAAVREHMASGDEPLYYSEADIRSFIGGLAMGRLILLQGISGTGKTSLPIAFARAVGTQASVIEVQAGWRDPQDLVGHYNAFEKRFHERAFLEALYRAGTPRWRDTIQVVLLDEMNLSYPEQYFSDMLSALELRPDQQRLQLMTHAIASAPSRFEEGRKLTIPPNVWFVGTANHDETTMNFADKTYDRAHVMEFPHRPEKFDAERPEAGFPVSFNAFGQAVESAMSAHHQATDRIWSYLEDNLREQLAKDFDIGWGPRLERQMQRYVPVVVAAGGTAGEAGDHLLAMRLLRKLKDRHSNRPERLDALKVAIRRSWFDSKVQPTKSIRLLDEELVRLDQDPDSGA